MRAKKSAPLDVSGFQTTTSYALRRLYSGYNGPLINVRRSSDNSARDVYYDSEGNLDVADLLSFVGTGSGYVTTWYDQSGGLHNVTQSTAINQPQIVNLGSVYIQNSMPSLYFNSLSYLNSSYTFMASALNCSFNIVCNVDKALVGGNGNRVIGETNSTNTSDIWSNGITGQPAPYTEMGFFNRNNLGGASSSWGSLQAFSRAALTVISNISVFNGNYQSYINGVADTAPVYNATGFVLPTCNIFTIGGSYRPSGSGFQYGIIGYISECVFYNNATTSASRKQLEYNQQNYFAVAGFSP